MLSAAADGDEQLEAVSGEDMSAKVAAADVDHVGNSDDTVPWGKRNTFKASMFKPAKKRTMREKRERLKEQEERY